LEFFGKGVRMSDVYDALKEHFKRNRDVELPGAKGAQGLKYKGKMFAMFHKGELLLKFSEERTRELIKAKKGLPHDPGTGKPMKDRVLVPAAKKRSWIKLCEESLKFVKGD
jgi:hypothetical protein